MTSYRLQNNLSCGCLAISRGEQEIEYLLKENNIPYKREYQFTGSKYRYDFAIFDNNNSIYQLIEFDGEQHFQESIKDKGWNTQEHYNSQKYRDEQKDIFAQSKGILLVRIPYYERNNITLQMLKLEDYHEIFGRYEQNGK